MPLMLHAKASHGSLPAGSARATSSLKVRLPHMWQGCSLRRADA